jgi:hypothetical protein
MKNIILLINTKRGINRTLTLELYKKYILTLKDTAQRVKL